VSAETEPVISVRQLGKSYPSVNGPLSILEQVDLELFAGDAVAITGPSGTGKSTLLYILGLLDQPTSGEVTLLGQHPHAGSALEQAQFRNQQIGFVFQDHHLLPQCTVLENVLIPTLAGSGVTSQLEQRARQLLDRVGLGHRLDHRPAQLSGGERQRTAVCRALILQPAILLADEPTGNLDQASADVVGQLLLELQQEQRTALVCVTHSRDLATRFPHQYQLRAGRLHSVNSATEGVVP
jgi:lipoprotein-releasing system ATP-binding protein